MNRTRVVVESISPRRKYFLTAMAIVAGFALLVIAYEMGQRRAGFNRMQSMAGMDMLQAETEMQATELRSLRERLAILETAASIDKEAYSQVETELVGLQSQISELEESLEFYRGIVSPDDSQGVRVQALRITEADAPRHYRIQLFLTQALRSDRPISGRVKFTFLGRSSAEPLAFAVDDVLSDSMLKAPSQFRFRYFQEIIVEIELPQGFQPENVVVEARPDGKKTKTVEESFSWQVKRE